MMFYLKYEYGDKCPTFQFSTTAEAKAHMSDNFNDVVWIAYVQKSPEEDEDSPDFFAYESIEEAYDAINEAHVETGGAVSDIENTAVLESNSERGG